jgi:uncharacterized protein (TIGR02246 family)
MTRRCATVVAAWLGAALVLSPFGARADPIADARAVAAAFQRAVAAGDAESVIALYDDDAWLIWPGRAQEARGKVAIAAFFHRELPAIRASNPMLARLVATPLGADTIAVVGHWQQGPEDERTEVRTTEVLVRRGGSWKYLIDHASVGAAPSNPRGRDERRRRRDR